MPGRVNRSNRRRTRPHEVPLRAFEVCPTITTFSLVKWRCRLQLRKMDLCRSHCQTRRGAGTGSLPDPPRCLVQRPERSARQPVICLSGNGLGPTSSQTGPLGSFHVCVRNVGPRKISDADRGIQAAPLTSFASTMNRARRSQRRFHARVPGTSASADHQRGPAVAGQVSDSSDDFAS